MVREGAVREDSQRASLVMPSQIVPLRPERIDAAIAWRSMVGPQKARFRRPINFVVSEK